MPLAANDQVVVHGDVELAGYVHDLARHGYVGLGSGVAPEPEGIANVSGIGT